VKNTSRRAAFAMAASTCAALLVAGPARADTGCTWLPEILSQSSSQVVGADSTNGYVGVVTSTEDHVVIWRGGTETDLGTPPAAGTYAGVMALGTDLNSAGTVTANSVDGTHGQGLGSVYEGGAWHPLPVPAGYVRAVPRAINEHGDITGSIYRQGYQDMRAVIWPAGDRGAVRFLETPAGTTSIPSDIDDAGDVVGQISNPDYSADAVLWNPSGAVASRQPSTTTPWRHQALTAITNGLAVGVDQTQDSATAFTLTSAGVRTDIAKGWTPVAVGPNGVIGAYLGGPPGPTGGVWQNGELNALTVYGGDTRATPAAVAGDGTVGGMYAPFNELGKAALWRCH
jgi:hypothetical protein